MPTSVTTFLVFPFCLYGNAEQLVVVNNFYQKRVLFFGDESMVILEYSQIIASNLNFRVRSHNIFLFPTLQLCIYLFYYTSSLAKKLAVIALFIIFGLFA